MNEQQKLFFQVNAGIKNIVGKELIHSDSIAIIELIKNSKDADATKSTIQFINEQKSQDSSLIISDNGKGMSLNDLKNKWLNVAYSEKKENMLNKLYAGNKGVGRFSCDRLGKNLTLYTKAQEGNYIKLSINWEDFENKGINDEMSTIPVLAQELSKHDFLQEINVQNFTTGTILKIENLRETWPTTKLRKLIAELEKFSPSIDDDFSIFLYSDNQDNTIANRESYGYITNIIRQLENFVVNGLEWNRLFDKQNPSSTKVISENDVLKNPERYTMRQISPEKVKAACEKLLKSNWKIHGIIFIMMIFT